MLARRPCLLVLVLSAACSRPPPSEPAPVPPTPPAQASPDQPTGGDPTPAAQPAATTPDGPKPGPVTAAAVVREATVLRPAGAPAALSAEGETVVEPDARFRLELGVESQDARLLLLDAADAVVPSKASHEIGDETRLTLEPTEPLVPGGRYVLRLDGAVGRQLHAGDQTYAPALYPLRVAGEPPPPLPSPKKRLKGKKHR